MKLFVLGLVVNCLFHLATPANAQTTNNRDADDIDIAPDVIQDSPVLQEWLQETPNVLEDIKYDPAFATRFRLGFTTFPTNDDAAGLNIAVEDIFIKRTGLTVSADYQTAFNGDRNAIGADLHYFLFPLGNYINFAPSVGYRYVQSNDFFTDGIHLGVRLMLSLSRTGSGDVSVSQSFINPRVNEEVGITLFSVGYALTPHLRLSADIERQNSIEDKDSRFGLNLEWSIY